MYDRQRVSLINKVVLSQPLTSSLVFYCRLGMGKTHYNSHGFFNGLDTFPIVRTYTFWYHLMLVQKGDRYN